VKLEWEGEKIAPEFSGTARMRASISYTHLILVEINGLVTHGKGSSILGLLGCSCTFSRLHWCAEVGCM
jgi:hypothetical protein